MVTAAYAAVVAALLSLKPLWLDEVLQLRISRQPALSDLFTQTAWNAGAAPLGYLVQHFSLAMTGYSVWTARLPSALFGVANVFAAGVLAWRLGMRRPWLASGLFAALPITLRYSTESRPYSQALFLSIVLTILFLGLVERPRPAHAGGYVLCVTAILYTQPLAALVTLAHVCWAAAYRQRRAAAWSVAAAAAAVAAAVPWFRWAAAGGGFLGGATFTFNWRTPLMIFREAAGAGYWGSAVLVILCVRGALKAGWERKALALLLLLIAVPLAGALMTDALFSYFVAARQFLWVLPAVAVLAAAGVERGARTDKVLALVLAVLCGYKSVRRFTAAGEDWDAASHALAQETDRGACLMVIPPSSWLVYAYFVPRLAPRSDDCPAVVAAAAPYASAPARAGLSRELTGRSYTVRRSRSVGGTTIAVWER